MKSGTGLLNLNNNNTYIGGTTVNSGTLALNWGGAIGTIRGVLNINPGATVEENAGDPLGYTVGEQVTTVNIVGGVINNNTGGIEQYTTNFALTGGTMSGTVGGGNNYFSFATGYETFPINASTATSLISAPLFNRGGNPFVFNVTGGSTASGIDLLVSGNMLDWNWTGMTLNGAGFMEVTGVNILLGTVAINGGTLQVGDGVANNGNLGNSGRGYVTDNATLIFDNPTASGFRMGISGSGNVVKSGPGAFSFTGNNNSYTGTTTINGGLLSFSQLPNHNSNSIVINAGGALAVSGPYSTIADWFSSGVISQTSAGVLALVGRTTRPSTSARATPRSAWGRPPPARPTAARSPPAIRPTTSAAAAARLTVSTALTGGNSLVAFAGGGSGALYLTGANNYTGSTTINGGMLSMSTLPNAPPTASRSTPAGPLPSPAPIRPLPAG